MLVSLNKGTAAMLATPTNPLGLNSYANAFFCFALLIDHVSKSTLYLIYLLVRSAKIRHLCFVFGREAACNRDSLGPTTPSVSA